MAQHLDPRKPTGAEIRRILRQQLVAAAQDATGRNRLGDRVHDARTAAKRVRATLQLIHSEVPRLAAAEAAWLRTAARRLAGAREAEVRVTAAGSLGKPELNVRDRQALRQVGARLSRVRAEVLADSAGVKVALEDFSRDARQSAKRVAKLELAGRGFELVGDDFVRVYRRARRGLARARQKGGDSIHLWRKASKAHAEHCRLLRAAWPKILKKTHRELATLGDLLGAHHDLENLSRFLKADGRVDPRARKIVRRLIGGRQEELLDAAIPIGRRLYADKPHVVRRRMARWWRAAGAVG